jgi:nucleotide-binding universal stress UspA family protein
MFKHILVAIDGSDYSQHALPVAIETAKRFDADLFVFHVAEHDRGRAAAFVVESPAEATRLVADAVKTAKDAGVDAKGELADRAAGHVAAAIVETAAAHDIDLIVMGSRGLSDAQGIMLGSVTHKVIQTADAPVLVARKQKSPVKAEPKAAGFAATAKS